MYKTPKSGGKNKYIPVSALYIKNAITYINGVKEFL